MVMIENITIEILLKLGFEHLQASERIGKGYGFAIINYPQGIPLAAFGFIFNDSDIEVWFQSIENINPYSLRLLKKAFIWAVEKIPANIPLVTHKNQNLRKVAFEKLALSCGFQILGDVHYPEGTFVTAKRFGGKYANQS